MRRVKAGALALRAGERLAPAAFSQLRRRLALDGCKWDLQLFDQGTLASFPLLISAETWRELAHSACALAAELKAALEEVKLRRELHERLAVPRAIRRHLRPPFSDGPSLLRFDFHSTPEGWRISEVNADVPGGLMEASLLPRLMGGKSVGDPSARWADAIARAAGGGAVALLSAAGYLEDHQVISWLARELGRRGVETHLASPSLIEWRDGVAWLRAAWHRGPLGALVRFYQAEWLKARPFFHGARTPICNPGVMVLAESKRFPLIWDALSTPLPTWRRLLPETRETPLDPREDWLWKKAYSNTGDSVTARAPWRRSQWAAQRRFTTLPIDTPDGPRFACLGVYVLDGEATGIYGRLARGPIVDWSASDVAVFCE